MTDKKTNISKFISLLLRHKPEVGGITLDKHGYAKVKDLLNSVKITMEELEDIVETDNKQRYSFNEDKTLIRANQGHSIPVDVELEEAIPPEILYHGTSVKYLSSIYENGIISKSRLYVHLSEDINTALEVGRRHGTPAILKINTKDMVKDGYKFYLSKNGVWMTKSVPRKYFTRLSKEFVEEYKILNN